MAKEVGESKRRENVSMESEGVNEGAEMFERFWPKEKASHKKVILGSKKIFYTYLFFQLFEGSNF